MEQHFNNINFFSLHLLKKMIPKASIITAPFTLLLTFFDFSSFIKIMLFSIMILILIFSYIFVYVYNNNQNHLRLFLDDSEIDIREGDIFSDKIYNNNKIIKIFAFNEYFDTKVDNNIIAKSSLNGQFINKKVDDVDKLNSSINNDERINKYIVSENHNKKKYELGTIFKYNDHVFLTALTHFDKNNKAYLSIQDYIRFLINFWDQIDELYAGRTVVITLFGSGITRLEHKMFNSTQILQIILWTLSLRRIKFKKPAKFIILIDEKTNKNINYYKVKAGFNDLQE